MKKQQIQKQLSAHDKILIFDNLRYLLEGLEEYIEKAGYYPDFKNKRQLQNITIPKEQTRNSSIDDAEDFFKTNLILYVSMVNEAPEFIRKGELMDEYYKWINAVGIDPNNCPEKLKQFLIEIKNVLEGNSERIIQQTQEYLDNKDKGNPYPTNPQDVLTLFGSIQKPLNKNREDAKSYEGKTYRDVEIANKLSGSARQGEKTFGQITGTVSSHGGFGFYSQQGQQIASSGSSGQNPQQTDYDTDYNRWTLIENIKRSINEWKIDEVITFASFNRTDKEIMLIHQSAQLEYNQFGALEFQPGKMFQKQSFSQQEWAEIEQASRQAQQQAYQQQPYK